MPLQKILLKPGVNRENTRYTTEGGWYECDKIRFRQGNPEMIGGWTRFSITNFAGVCRALWNWVTLAGLNLVGVGTNLAYYICQGGAFYNITPIRVTTTLTNPFSATLSSSVITVAATAHGCITGDYVTFSGAGITGLGGNITASVLTNTFQVTVTSVNQYTFVASATATAADVSGSPGGGTVIAQYQISTGPSYQVPLLGWGASTWGGGTWGNTQSKGSPLQLWNNYNFGEDLVYGPRGGGIYYWNASVGYSPVQITISIASPGVVTLPVGFVVTEGTAIEFNSSGALPTGLSVGTIYFVKNSTGATFNVALTLGGAAINTSGSQSGLQFLSPRGINLASIGDADTPLFQNNIIVSDTSRFVIVLGTNDYGADYLDPMLIRWSAQEDPFTWTPAATNQAGSVRLSHGSQIVTAIQTRQEIVVLTDQAVYSLQYLGPPYVWGSQLLGDNISIMGPNATALASGVVYWMGTDKFYKYDGRVQTLNCDLRRFVFQNLNLNQNQQVYASTNEGFNEIWWFYCSGDNTTVDRYVIYNYLENNWYYGTMARTAWLDSGLLPNPIAATYNGVLVNQEDGVNDQETGDLKSIDAYIASSEFDINDGHTFGFVWRVLPDLTFEGSYTDPTTGSPAQVTMTLYPMQNSGSGIGKSDSDSVKLKQAYTLTNTEQFTGQVYTRVRGRQMIFKIESNQIGTTWQLGAPRFDIRQDGRR